MKKNQLVEIGISAVLLLLSKNIAGFFGKQEDSFEIAGEKIENQ